MALNFLNVNADDIDTKGNLFPSQPTTLSDSKQTTAGADILARWVKEQRKAKQIRQRGR